MVPVSQQNTELQQPQCWLLNEKSAVTRPVRCDDACTSRRSRLLESTFFRDRMFKGGWGGGWGDRLTAVKEGVCWAEGWGSHVITNH